MPHTPDQGATPAPPHHDSRGFRNPHSTDAHGGWDALRWLPRFLLQPYRRVRFPVHAPAIDRLRDNRAESTLTWIGHSSFLLQLGGVNLITDPHFSDRASPLRFAGPQRYTPPALRLEQLPPLELALISHDHYDHLDEASVRALAHRHPALQFVVPLGLKAWLKRRGIHRVHELDWWQTADVAGLRIHAVPVQHFSGRGPHDRNRTLWCGFVAETLAMKTPRRVLFAGDTGYSPDFRDIRQRIGPMDLSLLPIGAYAPRWFMRAMHIAPEEAVRIHQDLDSQQSAAMHWGTFRLTEEPLDEPPQRLRRALDQAGIPPERFWVMQHGETRKLFDGV